MGRKSNDTSFESQPGLYLKLLMIAWPCAGPASCHQADVKCVVAKAPLR